jgi:hypothetical protein
MSKKLEELFNLPEISEEISDPIPSEEEIAVVEERLNEVASTVDKVNQALPLVKDLEAADSELDELAKLAKDGYEDLKDLGMNVDPRFSGVILQTASTLLGHAITAKTAKIDKKLKVVQLQLQKAKLDHQIAKDGDKEEDPVDGKGVILDRNSLLEQILNKSQGKK